jgi:hypothetical protein
MRRKPGRPRKIRLDDVTTDLEVGGCNTWVMWWGCRRREFPRTFMSSILGAGGNLAGREDGWMMSPLICLDFEAGGGGPWRGNNGRKEARVLHGL